MFSHRSSYLLSVGDFSYPVHHAVSLGFSRTPSPFSCFPPQLPLSSIAYPSSSRSSIPFRPPGQRWSHRVGARRVWHSLSGYGVVRWLTVRRSGRERTVTCAHGVHLGRQQRRVASASVRGSVMRRVVFVVVVGVLWGIAVRCCHIRCSVSISSFPRDCVPRPGHP
jgi:hypothetical protein